jgi:tetratricopeptide (TPR) repeat protein
LKNPTKTVLLLAGLAALVALQSAVAWNGWLLGKGRGEGSDPAERVRVLERAEAVFPWNAAVPFELGKAHFERGVQALGDPAVRDRAFELSVEAFLRSLRLDPGDAAVHFHLGQTLLYGSYLSLPAPLPYFEEYERAARLTGHNSLIHFEVGRVLLGRWPALAPKEKEFAVDILRRSLAAGDDERLREVLETWALEAADYDLIERVLPDDAGSLRTYARFLGQRALSPAKRHEALARAERLDLVRAGREIDAGRRDAEAFRLPEAAGRFRTALKALDGIHFYQALTGRELINAGDYEGLRRTALRLLAMTSIEETRSLVDEDGVVAAYLAAGDEFAALGEFERFLKERGLLGEGPTAAAPFKDLPTLAFRMTLDFHLNRYRDIVRTGDLLASSSIVVAPSGRPSYVQVLGLIGEANLKLDNVYEAERHFRLALDVDPGNLDALLGLERCYGRLSDEERAAEVRRRIEAVVGPARIDLSARRLAKGKTYAVAIVSDGLPATFRLDFRAEPPGSAPLVAVFLNGRVVWEKMGDTGFSVIPAALRAGRNFLEIEAVGGPLTLIAVTRLSSSK